MQKISKFYNAWQFLYCLFDPAWYQILISRSDLNQRRWTRSPTVIRVIEINLWRVSRMVQESNVKLYIPFRHEIHNKKWITRKYTYNIKWFEKNQWVKRELSTVQFKMKLHFYVWCFDLGNKFVHSIFQWAIKCNDWKKFSSTSNVIFW